MFYNVAQLLKGPTGGERRYYLSQDITALDSDLDAVQPIEGWIRLMRTSQGILALGTLRAVLQMECSRCLEPCEVEVEIELEEEFRPTVPISDAPVDIVPEEEQDDALLIDEHHILDLREVVRQGIWLAAPMEALCRVDCAGLCPHCGGNRNLGECTCEEPARDPRWAALQSLLITESESDERSEQAAVGALPKHKLGKGRKGKRRSHHGLRARNLVACPNCHEMRLPHQVCPWCGNYRGMKVIETKSE